MSDLITESAILPLSEIIFFTDGDAFLAPHDDETLHVIFQDENNTPNKKGYKDRSLHYSCLNSTLHDNT